MNFDNKNSLICVKDMKVYIHKTFSLFLFNLFKWIFIKTEKTPVSINVEKNLDSFIKKINEKIIKDNNKFINKNYSKQNFENIINFVRIQNSIFSGEIVEGILIYIISLAFETSRDNTLGKFIYSNIFKFKDHWNYDLVEMIKVNKFIPDELHDIKKLLDIDATADDKINERICALQDNSAFYNLVFRIYHEKYIGIKEKNLGDKNNKLSNYINKGFSDNNKISYDIYEKLKDNSTTALDKDISCNSIMFLVSNLFFDKSFGKMGRAPIRLIRSFLIQVFIYYQNKNSPLMNFITERQNYEAIPFVYDLRGACVEGRFAYIILAPTRIEPRINRINLSQNNLRECGFYEIGKVILFNKNIKAIELNTCLIRNNYIEYLNRALLYFDNYSVEELNLSYNYLKDISEEYLAKIISHFKGLKTINLTMNEFKRGLSSFLIVLKKLYRNGQTKLENLVIAKCLLDEATYYELGELLKCKYCKLKKLFLNYNKIPYNINFLKKLKKNKSLTEIYINKAEIGNSQVDDLLKIISNTKIHYLYLYKNQINNFDTILKILYRTKLIEDDDNNYNDDKIFLTNIDVSNNEIFTKNKFHIKLFDKIIRETTLNCIDISHVLLGPNPEKK